MIPFFTRRRDRLLTYRAMREGTPAAVRRRACPACGAENTALDWSRNHQVCPRCGRREGEGLSVEKLRELRKKFPGMPRFVGLE